MNSALPANPTLQELKARIAELEYCNERLDLQELRRTSYKRERAKAKSRVQDAYISAHHDRLACAQSYSKPASATSTGPSPLLAPVALVGGAAVSLVAGAALVAALPALEPQPNSRASYAIGAFLGVIVVAGVLSQSLPLGIVIGTIVAAGLLEPLFTDKRLFR
jgi:hypothetical protein